MPSPATNCDETLTGWITVLAGFHFKKCWVGPNSWFPSGSGTSLPTGKQIWRKSCPQQ